MNVADNPFISRWRFIVHISEVSSNYPAEMIHRPSDVFLIASIAVFSLSFYPSKKKSTINLQNWHIFQLKLYKYT